MNILLLYSDVITIRVTFYLGVSSGVIVVEVGSHMAGKVKRSITLRPQRLISKQNIEV